jgi:hypothetical protein
LGSFGERVVAGAENGDEERRLPRQLPSAFKVS